MIPSPYVLEKLAVEAVEQARVDAARRRSETASPEQRRSPWAGLRAILRTWGARPAVVDRSVN